MATRKNARNLFAAACLVLAALFVGGLYVAGCIQQARGKYRHERDTRDHVKGQIQPVPHELAK